MVSKKENIESKRIALNELQKAHDALYTAGDALDAKLQNIMNYSSIVVTIPSVIIASVLLNNIGIYFWDILGIILLIYLVNVIFIVIAISPSPYVFPISSKKEEIEYRYYSYNEEQALRQVITDHIKTINELNKKIHRKALTVRWSLVLMAIMVTLLLISLPIGLHFSTPTLIQFFSVPKP